MQAEGYSALSSTYHSIVGTAFSQLKVALRAKLLAPVKVGVWCFTWLPLSAYCHWRSLPLSNRVVELIDYEGMSADQCDIRQSVLCRRGQYKEAKKCIEFALEKNPEAHTRGLLRVGLAKIYQREGDLYKEEQEISKAVLEAAEAEEEYPLQAARIYRHCAEAYKRFMHEIWAQHLREKAETLMETFGAKDQLLKL